MRVRAAAGLASIAVVAGCGGAGSGDDPLAGASAPVTTPQPSAVATTPSALVGQWSVAGPGIATPSVVNLAADGLELFHACGSLEGVWLAGRAGTFLAEVSGGSGECFPDEVQDPTPAWIASAVSYAVDGDTRRLLDAGGQTVATLSPGPNDASAGPAPTANAEQIAALDAPTPALPAGLRPVTEQDLVGVWLMPGATSNAGDEDDRGPHAEFLADGIWGGSDGCNGTAGRWALVEGALLTTDEATTPEDCTPTAVLDGARAAGFAGEQLVLLDPTGRELRRLDREPSAPAAEGDAAEIDELPGEEPSEEPTEAPQDAVE
ncbi:MAG: META domain-containing protein [Sporichthyaceae bacterium]